MYQVLWNDDAAQQVVEFYFGADGPTRARVNAAIVALEQLLAENPLAIGESREGSDRIAICDCICVMFFVDDAQRVTVFDFWVPARH